MVVGALKSALLLAGVTYAEAECAGAWEECTKRQCCSTPFFECVERNANGALRHDKKGPKHKAYAQCRSRKGTGHGWALKSCPCDATSNTAGTNPPSCLDYSDYKTPENERVPWNCIVLTGGCNGAYKGCGVALGWSNETKKTWQDNPDNIACCQWGCECKFTKKEVATCQPPKGMFACTKEEEAKGKANKGDRPPSVHDEEEALSSKDDALFKSLGISDEDLKAADAFSVSKDGTPVVQPVRSQAWAWLLGGAGAMAMVTVSMVAMRKARSSRTTYLDTSPEVESAE